MTTLVAWAAVISGAICLIAGLVSTAVVQKKRFEMILAISTPGKAGAAGDVRPTAETVSRAAGALNDLDALRPLMTMAMGFFGVAAISAGVGSLASALN